MTDAVDSRWLARFDGRFSISGLATRPPEIVPKPEAKKQLREQVRKLSDLQEKLYASDAKSVLLVFQAMDAAGKDGTIRAILKGVNPVGCQVFSFKRPSAEELEHDFLWRTARSLPERGRIGVFNRSYYEEVLVVKVHPEYLSAQRVDFEHEADPERFWAERYESIRDHELHLARNGTLILKFWLNVSREEQTRRFLDRIHEKDKNWKFSAGDLEEAERWDDYMQAYEKAISETSRPWAPWYTIPADHKPTMRLAVADIVVRSLESLGLSYPSLSADEEKEMMEHRGTLESALGVDD